MGAVMGTTAPCSTGFASTGILRLGKRFGRREWRAVPTVCGCWRWGCCEPRAAADSVLPELPELEVDVEV